ncbi:MAG: hypothetical protein NVSMB45_16860 [Ginsengibacter sp.]
MKKVIIIGANGSLAGYVIDALKQLEDVALTLFVRNKSRLYVKKAISGQDIVYINLAGNLEPA